jgi:DNA-binding winged helix-turn-helix (wHTH) protein/Tol biopolymer transport system component
MSSSPQAKDPHRQRFDNYEVDSRAGELRKHGYRVPLEDRPFRALEILLKHAPEVVTREELKKELWPADVFVDFDHGLNKAIGKVRRALNDNAEQPRFIETVGRRGYRFIAPISPSVAHAQVPEPAVAPPPTSNVEAEEITPNQHRGGSRHLYATAAAFVAIVVVAFLFRPTTPKLQVAQIVQITKSGDAWHLEPMYTDGPRLYYQASSWNEPHAYWGVKQVLLNGNEETVIPGTSDRIHSLRIRGLSPDYTEFLALTRTPEAPWTGAAVVTLPVVGGSPRPLGTLVADSVARSPDGATLAYTKGHQLFVAKSDGSGSRLLLEAAGDVTYPTFSPDDHRLSFTVLTEQQSIWDVGVDGSGLHERRFDWPGKPLECCGVWTPDQRYFVFRSRRNGLSNLWAVEEKSPWWRRANRDPAQLTFGPMNFYQPLPSRNGKLIYAIGALPSGELVRHDAKKKDYVPFLGGQSASVVEFSRDGEWVAYVTLPERQLWRARIDGTEAFQLTLPPLQVDAQPRWSADGTRIAFSAKRPGELLRLYMVSVKDGKLESLPSQPRSQASPDWMPDGNSLVYGCGLDECSDFRLYRLDLRSLRDEEIPETAGLYDPVWSPDHQQLAAIDNANHRLTLVDLKTGKRTPLSHREARYPVWSADSQYVYYGASENKILRVRVPNGLEEPMLELNFRSAGPFNLAPDGALIFSREHGHYDVYALELATSSDN